MINTFADKDIHWRYGKLRATQQQYEHKNYFVKFNDALHQHKFDVGATFTFKDGNIIREQNVIYLLRLFFNELSKIYFGKHKDRNGIQVERVVFLHRTHEGGRWMHAHIAMRSVGNRDKFKQTVNNVWKRHVYNGLDIHFEDVRGGMGTYGLREQNNWDGIKFNGKGTGKHRGKTLITDTKDGCWLHDLQHIDRGTSYYIRQQQALDTATQNRLTKLFQSTVKPTVLQKLRRQEQWNTMSDVQVNAEIANNF